MSLQTKFEKEAVDNAVDSAHSVCRPVRFAVSRSRFLGVGGSGRRPLESADPGVRRVGAIGTESNAGLGLAKLYRGWGRGSTGGHHMSTLVSRIGGFMMGK